MAKTNLRTERKLVFQRLIHHHSNYSSENTCLSSSYGFSSLKGIRNEFYTHSPSCRGVLVYWLLNASRSLLLLLLFPNHNKPFILAHTRGRAHTFLSLGLICQLLWGQRKGANV